MSPSTQTPSAQTPSALTTSALFRSAAGAGLVCALVLVLNVGRRLGFVPDDELTRAIAPLAALSGVFALTGLHMWQRDRLGALGLIGYALNAVGLAGAFAIEYVVQFVFPYLGMDVVLTLVDGPTGVAFRATAVVLLIGVLVFGAASWRARVLPRAALVLYVAGMIPGALRTAVPVPVYLIGLLAAAFGVGWMSLALRRAHPADARRATPGRRVVNPS
jgi:hypothetical protein